ncbi:MAG: ATP-binding protein [Anaerolineae bacterium]|nr:ATP-binding protein [Anaerolineae bacterium]MDQ7035871.1 ATP-binding protein [Anaerolineae bacterium]
MPLENPQIIALWTEDDLLDIPPAETDDYEFKSSLIRKSSHYRTDLRNKIVKTASAFWNTGGGILLVGVDDKGQVDGGIPMTMGKQKIRDWVDTVLTSVTPVGPYEVRTIEASKDDSRIEADCVVLVVAFGESFDLPHMAPDKRYYVRAGAHSNPANHYLVEAIRARRGLRRPMLRALLRENPQKAGVVELAIVAVNDLPALNVSINFQPIPTHLQEQMPSRLPLIVPLIDRNYPFRMDIATLRRLSYWLGDDPFEVILQYEGVRGTRFEEQQPIDHHRSVGPAEIRLSNGKAPEKMFIKLYKQISRLNSNIEQAVNGHDEDSDEIDTEIDNAEWEV